MTYSTPIVRATPLRKKIELHFLISPVSKPSVKVIIMLFFPPALSAGYGRKKKRREQFRSSKVCKTLLGFVRMIGEKLETIVEQKKTITAEKKMLKR